MTSDVVSPEQETLWVAQQLQPDSAAYNVALCFRIAEEVDSGILSKAWELLLARHEQWRASFRLDSAGYLGLRHDGPGTPLGVRPMASLTTPEDLRRLVADIIGEPFRLAQAGGPCRAVLLRNEDGRDSVLVVVAHHIVTDFVTHGAMVSELLEMYTALALGEQPETQPPRPYTDYARDVRAMNEGAEGSAARAYWDGVCSTLRAPVGLGLSQPDGLIAVEATGTLEVPLPEAVHSGVRAYARKHGTTAFVVLLAEFQRAVGAVSGQYGFAVVCPTTSRLRRHFPGTAGCFVQPVLIPGATNVNDFEACVMETRSQASDALEHAGTAMTYLAGSLGGAPGDISPLSQFAFGFQQAERAGPLLDVFAGGERHPGAVLGPLTVRAFEAAQQEGQFDLAGEVSTSGVGAKLTLRYRTRGCSRSVASEVGRTFVRHLEDALV